MAAAPQSNLVSAIISCILCLVIFATLRFYRDWFRAAQVNTIFSGFVGSWVFLFSLTAVSNVEMIIFGSDFQAKFMTEIMFCIIFAVCCAGVVHRVAATSCILFSFVALYYINRISTKYHQSSSTAEQPVNTRRVGGGKKNK